MWHACYRRVKISGKLIYKNTEEYCTMQFSERIMLSIVDKYKLSTMRRNGKINKKLWNGRPQRCPLMNFHLSFTESNRKITMQSLTWKHFNRFQLTTMTLFALWFDYGAIISSIFNSVSNFFIKIFFFILRLVFFSLKKTVSFALRAEQSTNLLKYRLFYMWSSAKHTK